MRLVRFRIQNYKRIEATEWIEMDDVVALVGGNETGKTSVLQALWKLKPGRETVVLDAQREFPRRRYTADYLKGGLWPVVTAVFDLEPELREELAALDAAFDKVKQVEVTSYYDHDPTVAFHPDVELDSLSAAEVSELVGGAQKTVEKAQPEDVDEEALAAFQDAFNSVVKATLKQLDDKANRLTPAGALSTFRDDLNVLSEEAWQKDILRQTHREIDDLLKRPAADERFQRAINLIWEAVPVFIYFDDYNLLESEVYIPEALQRIAAGSSDPKVRSQWALFQRAGFPIKEVSGLSYRPEPNQPVSQETLDGLFEQIKERAIIATSAGRTITEEFSNWWHQHRHEIDFRVDGETFQIWVADDKYPILIEFEGRSRGFRWFFTFYLVFSVETDFAHKNAVLLLDEPGLHLYPPAQEELLDLFDELSQHNQVAFTTHSPYMIDSQHLERVRVVEEQPDGSVSVTNGAFGEGGDLAFPVKARLSNQLAQSMFVARRVLLVAGEAEYELLSFLSEQLKALERTGLPGDAGLIFAGGASAIQPLVSMMVAQGYEAVVLVGADGRSAERSLKEAGFLNHPAVALGTYGDVLSGSGPHDAMSLLPRDLYREAVVATHDVVLPEKLKATKTQTPAMSVSARLEREAIAYDAVSVVRWLLAQWVEGEAVPDATLSRAEAIFEAVRDTLETLTAGA